MRQSNPNFMNGVPELLVLRLLREREMYGYELVQEIRSCTGQVVTLGEGVVYPVLHGLEKDGCLRSTRKSVDGRKRVYYALTPGGEGRLSALSDSWARLTRAIDTVMRGSGHAAAV